MTLQFKWTKRGVAHFLVVTTIVYKRFLLFF